MPIVTIAFDNAKNKFTENNDKTNLCMANVNHVSNPFSLFTEYWRGRTFV